MQRGLVASVFAAMLGIVAADRGLGFAPWAVPLACGLLMAGSCLATRPRLASALIAGAAFAIGGTAFEAGRLPDDAPSAVPFGTRVTLQAHVNARRVLDDRIELELDGVVLFDASPRVGTPSSGGVRLYVSRDEPAFAFLAGTRSGDHLRLHVRLRPVDGPRNPGAPNRVVRHRRRGVWAHATLAHPDAVVRIADRGRVPGSHGAIAGAVAALRERRAGAVARLNRLGDGGAVIAALGLGAADALAPGVRDDLARLGLSHLVAVSGLHLAMVAALGFAASGAVCRLARVGAVADPTIGRSLAALASALAYAWLSGFGVPARRALVLLSLGVALHATGRRAGWPAAWALAASAVLVLDPAALFELGPQLSFGVTAALAAARLDLPLDTVSELGRLRRTTLRALRLVEVSSVALAASAAILALHGRPSSSWALLANAIAVPLTAMALLPAALLGGMATLLGLDGPWADASLVAMAAAIGATLGPVRAAAHTLPAPLPPPPPDALAMLVAAGCVAVAVRAPAPSLRGVAALVCVTVVGSAPSIPVAAPRAPELLALDVGQGDALLLHDGVSAMLVDAGWADPRGGWDAGARVVVPALRALAVRRLDLLIVTHADLDHRGGVPAVLDAIAVGRVWLPEPTASAPAWDALRSAAARRGVPIEVRARGAPRERIGGFTVEVLWPPAGREPLDPNEGSIVVRVEAGGTHALLMGDAGLPTEQALLQAGDALASDILKIGHHGSRSASGEAFLRAVAPSLALVSAGCGVGRALPHPDVLARVEAHARVAWTGRAGAVRARFAASSSRARTDLDRRPGRICRGPAGAASALPHFGPSLRFERRGNVASDPGVGAGRSEPGRAASAGRDHEERGNTCRWAASGPGGCRPRSSAR